MAINKTGVVLSLTVLFLVFAVNFGSAFSGNGAGTLANPFNITNCTQLDEVRNNLTANYSLIADINFSAVGCTQYRTGAGWSPIGNTYYDGNSDFVGNSFSGTFSGNNKKIYNLYINNDSSTGTQFQAGLFWSIGHNSTYCGKVYDLGLIDVNITSWQDGGALAAFAGGWDTSDGLSGCSVINNTYATGIVNIGTDPVGGLVGTGINLNISHSYANLTVIGRQQVGGLIGIGDLVKITYSNFSGYVRSTGNDVGGLVGSGSSIKINNSYSTAMVNGSYNVGGLVGSGGGAIIYNSYATGKVTGTQFNVGGLIGYAENATITYAYATGDVRADKDGLDVSYVGGFAGFADGATFSNVYSVGNVSGTGSSGIGGLIGSGTLTVPGSNYWDVNTSHQTTSSGGTGLTTLEIKNVNTFNIWSIAAVNFGVTNSGFVWNIVNTSTYPFLSWETARTNPDLTAPLLLTISSTHTTSSATINWTTSESANSSVKYGTTLALSSGPINDVNFNNNYTIISDLSANTLYYYNLTICDSVGNCATNGTFSFTTDAVVDNTSDDSGSGSSGGGGGGGGGADTGLWTLTYPALNSVQFNVGYARELVNRSRIGFKLGNDTHHLGIVGITNTSATINVSSTPQIKILSVGEEWKVDANADNAYDLLVKLINISGVKANVSIKSINESSVSPISNAASGNATGSTTSTIVSDETVEQEFASFLSAKNIIVALVILVILAIVFWFAYFKGKLREKRVEKAIRYSSKNDK